MRLLSRSEIRKTEEIRFGVSFSPVAFTPFFLALPGVRFAPNGDPWTDTVPLAAGEPTCDGEPAPDGPAGLEPRRAARRGVPRGVADVNSIAGDSIELEESIRARGPVPVLGDGVIWTSEETRVRGGVLVFILLMAVGLKPRMVLGSNAEPDLESGDLEFGDREREAAETEPRAV
jgi:hypothetical protein